MVLYEILKLQPSATHSAIGDAYKKIREKHPMSRLDRIVRAVFPTYSVEYAYAVLSNPGWRREYDKQSDLNDANVAIAVWWN